MAEIKEKLKEWLVKFGVEPEYIRSPAEEDIQKAPEENRDWLRRLITVPYLCRVPVLDEEPVSLEARILHTKDWIQIKLSLMTSDNIPKNVVSELHRQLLIANFNLNEVTYSISPDGGVFVEADMPIDTNYENFKSEYGSVEYGIEHFFQVIVPQLGEKVETHSTYDPKRTMYM